MIEEFQIKFKEKALIIITHWLSNNNAEAKAVIIDSDVLESIHQLLEAKYKPIWNHIFKLCYMLSNEKKVHEKISECKLLNKFSNILSTEEDMSLQDIIISLLCELAFNDDFSMEIRFKCLNDVARILNDNISKATPSVKKKYVIILLRARIRKMTKDLGITCKHNASNSLEYYTHSIKIDLSWEYFCHMIYLDNLLILEIIQESCQNMKKLGNSSHH